jgi:uncharacterized repeat protein (TIGR01451 family)
VLAHGGSAVGRAFTFTASMVGGPVVATLQLADGSSSLGTVTFVFTPPATATFSNTDAIIIPDHGSSMPYPSIIAVSGLTGLVSKATVALNNFNHTFPSDVDVLLVSPSGQKVVVMSSAGGGHPVTSVNLNFDDAAASSLPASDPLVSGTFLPTDYAVGGVFYGPAPAGPQGVNLATFKGANPNGNWSLYVYDHSVGDAGYLAGGWSLTLTVVNSINPVAGVSVTMTEAPNPVFASTYMTYTIAVANAGPAAATNVVLTDPLPASVNFVSASLSQGVCSNFGGLITCNLGSLAPGGSAAITLVTLPTVGGIIVTNTVAVTASQTDLNLTDNTAASATSILNSFPPTLAGGYTTSNQQFHIILTGQPGQTYVILGTTNLLDWTAIYTNSALDDGTIKFTDTGTTNFLYRFYRAMLPP